jgi:HPt (histidine-containing phosphotransfer) domain-containing protein
MNVVNATTKQKPVYSEFNSDPDFEELLEMFVEAIPEKKTILSDSYESAEYDEIKRQAHQLKGAGGGYGFDGLTDLAAELEPACKANDIDRVGQTLDTLLGYMDRIAV